MREAKQTLVRLIKKYGVTLIAIGNGTASKETEIFTDETLRENHLDIDYMVVSEAGASVYSASKLAAAEYPESRPDAAQRRFHRAPLAGSACRARED